MAENNGNLFLHGFSMAELGGESIDYTIGAILTDAGQPPEFVYFPHLGSVASVTLSTAEGGTVEAGIVGDEGFVNIHSIIAEPARTRTDVVVQAPGVFTRVPTAGARGRFQSDGQFRDRVLMYTSNFLNQITQHAVCNRLHSIERRLAKWLLAMSDRAFSDELHLTHEFLSHMLGIHRPGVSIAVSALELDGMIVHGRNLIVVRDREGLLERTCECYGVVREDLVRLRGAFA
jgi:CRP-like cAMP-binding protein